jgi:hypothetical protein
MSMGGLFARSMTGGEWDLEVHSAMSGEIQLDAPVPGARPVVEMWLGPLFFPCVLEIRVNQTTAWLFPDPEAGFPWQPAEMIDLRKARRRRLHLPAEAFREGRNFVAARVLTLPGFAAVRSVLADRLVVDPGG